MLEQDLKNSDKEYKMDKRRYERINIDEPVGVHVGENYKVEKARQFSEAGMLFESIRDFTQGQALGLTFQLSDSILIRLDGQVAYIFKPIPGKKLIGVRFLETNPEKVKTLIEFFTQKNLA
jgi:hypothetical protein